MKMKFIILIVILIILFGFLVFSQVHDSDESYPFQIHFFNAGKADSMIISNEGKYVMIDTGEDDLSNDILKYCEENDIQKIDTLIITHFDKDHVGSAGVVIKNLDIGEVLQSNYVKESEAYQNYLNALAEKNITPMTVSDNYSFTVGDMEFTVNGPDVEYEKNASNNSSLIVSLTFQNQKFLFMGDSENDRIEDFLENNTDTYNFLKVPYHGHYLKQMENLISNTKISYAVITSSDEEMEDERTIETLKKYSVSYYLTREGSITLLSNGEEIKIKQ